MISVCIAIYNDEKFVKKWIDSILCQTGNKDESIATDNFSSDRAEAIVRCMNNDRAKFNEDDGHGRYAGNFELTMKQAKNYFIFLSDQDNI